MICVCVACEELCVRLCVHVRQNVCEHVSCVSRALCRTKSLPVTRVLVDTLMLTVKTVYKLLNVSDDLKWTTNTRDTIFTHFQGITNNIYGFGRPFFAPSFFYPPTHISTHPYSLTNDRWTGLYIKLSMCVCFDECPSLQIDV